MMCSHCSTAVVISVHTGDAVSRVLAASWNPEGVSLCRMSRQEICIAARMQQVQLTGGWADFFGSPDQFLQTELSTLLGRF